MEKNKQYKVIALFGKSGAGKDTILNWLVSTIPNAKRIVNHTTRPKREYEIDGNPYHFISHTDFANKVLDGSMIEATEFNNWFYGTSIEELNRDKINIGIFNIYAIQCLLQNNQLDVLPIYIHSYDKTRLLRNLSREDSPNCYEICRRFITDEKDFDDIDFDHVTYLNVENNPTEFNINKIPEVVDFLRGQD